MNANAPNAAMLERVAKQLGVALRQDMVFVGCAVAGLLNTDPAMPAIRPTEDVDLIFEALANFHRFEKTLRTHTRLRAGSAPRCADLPLAGCVTKNEFLYMSHAMCQQIGISFACSCDRHTPKTCR